MDEHDVRRGATVRNRKRDVLGTIVVSCDRTFIVTAGGGVGEEFSVRLTDVVELDGEDIIIGAELEELRKRNDAEGGAYIIERPRQIVQPRRATASAR